MWNWYEYFVDIDGNTICNECKVCKSFPAINLTYQDDHEYDKGPFCEFHWILEINKKFHELEKKLDKEDL